MWMYQYVQLPYIQWCWLSLVSVMVDGPHQSYKRQKGILLLHILDCYHRVEIACYGVRNQATPM